MKITPGSAAIVVSVFASGKPENKFSQPDYLK